MFFIQRPLALPPRDFPLLLRSAWRIDNTPQAGRLRDLAFIGYRPKAARPATYRIAS